MIGITYDYGIGEQMYSIEIGDKLYVFSDHYKGTYYDKNVDMREEFMPIKKKTNKRRAIKALFVAEEYYE